MAMEIFKLVGSIFVDTDSADKSISKTEEKTVSLGSKMAAGVKTAAKWGAGIATAAAGIAGAAINAAKKTATMLDTIDKGAKRMGISTDAYQELSYAAGLCGVEMSTLEQAAKKLNGTDLSLEEAIDQISSITDETERSEAAIALFGNSLAYQMAPMLDESTGSIAAMKAEAHELGLVISGEAVEAGAQLGDKFAKVDKAFETIKTNLMITFMPVIEGVLDWLTENMPAIQEMFKNVFGAISGFFSTLSGELNALGINWKEVWGACGTLLEAAFKIIKPILMFLIFAIGRLITLLADFIQMITDVAEFFKGNSIPGITHMIENNKRDNGGDVAPVGSPQAFMNFPKMASGGILEAGEVGLLEGNGAEAVVPLSQNKAWTQAVARDMTGALGGSEVSAKLDQMIELLSQGSQIFLDGDTLVGGVINRVDSRLGAMQMLNARTR